MCISPKRLYSAMGFYDEAATIYEHGIDIIFDDMVLVTRYTDVIKESKIITFLVKIKPRCERGDPVDETGKPGWGGKDSSLDHPRVHWCCQVCQGTPVFPLDKSEGLRKDQSNGDVNAQTLSPKRSLL